MKKALITNCGTLIKLEIDGVLQKDSANSTKKLFNSGKMQDLLKKQGFTIITCKTDLMNLA